MKQSVTFPVTQAASATSTGNVPAGSLVKLLAIEPDEDSVTIAYGDSTRSVPIEQTDLLERTRAFLTQTDAEATATPTAESSTQARGVPMLSPRSRSAKIRPTLPWVPSTPIKQRRSGCLHQRRRAAFVVLYNQATGTHGRVEHPLTQRKDGFWELRLDGDWQGKFYCYRLEGSDSNPRA